MTEFKTVIKLDYDKKTYNAWSDTLVGIFRGKDLLDIVEGTIKKVEKATKDGEKDKETPNWTKRDNEAASIITQTLMPSELRYINTRTDTSNEMWLKLKKRYVVSMYSAMKMAENALKDYKFKEKDMMKHVECFNGLKLDYEDLGGVKSDLEYCQLFLDTLSELESWEAFRVVTNLNEFVMDHSSGQLVPNKITLSYLQTDAMDKFNKIGSPSKSKDHSANSTMGTLPKVDMKVFAKRNTSFNTSISCYNCGGFGHQKNQCTSGIRDSSVKIQNARIYNGRNEKQNDRRDERKDERRDDRRGDQRERRNNRPSAAHTHNTRDEAWNTGNTERQVQSKFLLDNCCTATIINDKSFFTKYQMYDTPLQLGTFRDAPGNGDHNDILGEGEVEIISQYNGRDHIMKLSRCLYVPRARNSLICQGQLFKRGYTIDAQPEGTYVMKGDQTVAFSKTMDNHLQEFLSFRSIRRQGGNANFVETKSKISPNLLHCRLGHPSMKRVKAMSESENYDGLHLTKKIMKDDLDCKCVSCLVGKSKSLPHKRFNKTKEYDLGELIHLDFKPLTPGSSLDGKDTGFFACVEAASGLCRLYECNSKAEQLECFMDFHKFVERQLNTKVKAVRHDRGSEYLNHKFMSYLKSYGIVDQTTASYSHESAKIETFIRLLDMIAKTIMAHAQVPKMYLKRAYFFAAYLYNRVPGPNGNSPYQLFTGTKPRVDHLRVPFCKVVYHLPKETRKKGDIPGKVGRFIGYSKNSDTYTVWNGDKVIITRDVNSPI